MGAKDAVGAYGERVAVQRLTAAGFEVLDRNWRCDAGELDIVARDPEADEIVFVEVKTRTGTAFGHPAEAVVGAKLARLRRLAARWLVLHDVHASGVRIDVVAVWPQPSGPARVEHLRAVA
ncbi:YraN family protein [Georgenia faecalis]|uniref:YraN family protein n=1 Tax=Georgenia faecalis TaxID=2483799 RepID=UPI000FD77B29|nr:YraN family protein [Georgenia faecalis]